MAENTNFVHDPVRTAIAAGLPPRERIGSLVMPIHQTGGSSFKYLTLDPSRETLKANDSRVGATALPNEVKLAAEYKDGSTDDHSLVHHIPNKKIDEAPEGFDPVDAGTKVVTENLWNGHEARVAAKVKDTANYSNHRALTADEKFSKADADVLGLTYEFLNSPLLKPNTLVMGRDVSIKYRTHPVIVKAISASGSDSGMVSLAALAELLEVERILVGNALINTSKGKTPNFTNPWAGVFAGLHINPDANPVLGEDAATWGITAESMALDILTSEDGSRGTRGVTSVKAAMEINELVISKEAGFLLTAVL